MNLVGLVVITAFAMLLGPALAAGETPPTPLKPVNTAAPALTGTPAVGQTLSCSQGSWANNPTSFAYAWLRDGSLIAGQTASAYTVQSADQGHSISCQVTAGNSGGQYTIPSLASGSYKVSFFGFEGGNYVSQYFNGKSSSSAANAVAVIAGGTTSGIDAALRTGGQVTGKVTDALSHASLPHIEVCASPAGSSGFGGCAVTNAAGEYTISGLESGSYKIEFFAGFEGEGGNYATQYFNGKSTFAAADAVAVIAGSTTSGINAEMHPNGQIVGKVTDASKVPLANIRVCAFEAGGGGEFVEFGRCASTNGAGEYTILDLAGGFYKVKFSAGSEGGNYATQYFNGKSTFAAANEVAVITGSTTSGINAEMQTGGQITGQVTDASTHAPLAKITVCANEAVSGELGGCAPTNTAGQYTISGLTEVHYKVEFSAGSEGGNYATQYFNGKPTFAEADEVAVIAGFPTSGIDAKMQTGGQITGQVTDASTHVPLANIKVCASRSGFGYCASTNAAGEYTISGLTSGSYKVEYSACGLSACTQNYLAEYYNGKSTPASADAVAVVVGSTTSGINAAMHPGGQIVGRVTDASSGAGIAGIEVCAVKVSGGGFGSCAVTNAAGPSTSATSYALAVPAPNSTFTVARAPTFNPRTGELDFFFRVVNAGTFRWSLSFKNADVGFADALGLGLGRNEVAEAARRKRRSKRCKAGFVKHGRRCVHLTVPFASGSRGVNAGTVVIKVHASSKARKALNAGRTLHVSGPFTFQSALGGAPVTHVESAVVHGRKKARKHGRHKGR
jgi:Carboxypeptidase regulatory-like domain